MQVSAKEFAAKYKSKKECYDFLTVSVGAYLCDKENLTIYFLKDMISGKKKCKLSVMSHTFPVDVKCDKLKVIFVPYYT